MTPSNHFKDFVAFQAACRLTFNFCNRSNVENIFKLFKSPRRSGRSNITKVKYKYKAFVFVSAICIITMNKIAATKRDDVLVA